MAIALLASQVPIPNYYSGLLTLADIEAYNFPPPVSRTIVQGMIAEGPPNITRNAGGQDLQARYGCGAYGVANGLGLSDGGGLDVVVAAGAAVADGVIDVPEDIIITITNGGRNHLWLCQDGTGTHELTALTVPTGGIVYLGSVVASGGAISGAFDYSGVVYIKNGVAERSTADPAEPGDVPSAETRYWTKTLGGLYWWDGAAYHRLSDGMSPSLSTIPAGKTVTIPTGMQQIVNTDSDTPFEVLGTLDVLGRMDTVTL